MELFIGSVDTAENGIRPKDGQAEVPGKTDVETVVETIIQTIVTDGSMPAAGEIAGEPSRNDPPRTTNEVTECASVVVGALRVGIDRGRITAARAHAIRRYQRHDLVNQLLKFESVVAVVFGQSRKGSINHGQTSISVICSLWIPWLFADWVEFLAPLLK